MQAIDFFCGGGGMTYGLRQAGIDVVAGVDFDADAKETYETNNPGSLFVLADVNRLNRDFFEKEMGVQKNDDDLILVGCSPCQYYSLIRSSKDKSEKSRGLLLKFWKFIDYYNPGYVLVENVPGILDNKRSVLPEFLRRLQKKGYSHIIHEVVNMKDYGVPQNRRRFSLIATRLDKELSFPQPESQPISIRQVLGAENGFPRISAGHTDDTGMFHSTMRLCEINLKRLKKTHRNGGNRLCWKNDPELQLPCYKGKDKSFLDVYDRMFWDKPSPTITTKFYSISNGRFAHPQENRGLSIREGATLQSFPKDYKFCTSSIVVAAKLIGNAVPPRFAEKIGKFLVR
ncbi:MAG: DNA cytosine methyltransferase [Fibrobacteraceae bacterium]